MNKAFWLKSFFKAFLLCVFCASFAHSRPPAFASTKLFLLAKDQKAYLFITEKATLRKETFEFSWTLYDGLNLVVHSKWRLYPRQIMFSRRRGLELYSQNILLARKNPYLDEVRVYIEFLSFEAGAAKFGVHVMDKSQRVGIEYYPNPEVEDEQN